ncbi:MAG: AraC family transcriptional regulator [Roseiflexaceae bacterium]
MKQNPVRPDIKIWRLPGVAGVEFLRAAAITQPLPKQFHEEFVVGVMEHGAHEMYYRGTTYTAAPGSLILAQPGEITSCGPTAGAGRSFRAIHMPASFFQEIVTDVAGQPTQIPVFPDLVVLHAHLKAGFLRVHKLLEVPTSHLERSLLLHNLLAQLILCYATEPPIVPSSGQEHGPVQRVRTYLHDHYAEDVSLEELVRLANLSAFHLNRVFRQTVGLPPHAYQTQVRVERAKALLAQGVPIRQVALLVGFFDQSHLNYHFKRLLGFTPGTYQQNMLAR